jgi:hypothetical protein
MAAVCCLRIKSAAVDDMNLRRRSSGVVSKSPLIHPFPLLFLLRLHPYCCTTGSCLRRLPIVLSVVTVDGESIVVVFGMEDILLSMFRAASISETKLDAMYFPVSDKHREKRNPVYEKDFKFMSESASNALCVFVLLCDCMYVFVCGCVW